MKKNRKIKLAIAASFVHYDEVKERICFFATNKEDVVLEKLNTTANGLNEKQILESKKEFGSNVITQKTKKSLSKRIVKAIINPFNIILFILAITLIATKEKRNIIIACIILTAISLLIIVRFIYKNKNENSNKQTIYVERESQKKEVVSEDIVVGDIIYLSSGDIVPADIRILSCNDLYVNQSALTKKNDPIKKISDVCTIKENLTDINNLAFKGSIVIKGSAKAVVLTIGNDTLLAIKTNPLIQLN